MILDRSSRLRTRPSSTPTTDGSIRNVRAWQPSFAASNQGVRLLLAAIAATKGESSMVALPPPVSANASPGARARPEAGVPFDAITDVVCSVRRNSPVPLWAQLEEAFVRVIVDGRLRPGQRLEPEDKLSRRLAISRSTLRRVLQLLVDRGLLVRRRGVGSFVEKGS